jgi:hypothetical protein
MTRGADQVITKLNIEFEHFIGTPFWPARRLEYIRVHP